MRKLAILIFLLSVPASAKQHRVSLTWTASTGCPATCTIAGYYVYKAKGSAPFAKANPSLLTTLYWTDKNVYAGQVIHYVVTAVSSAGVESPYSNQEVAKIPWR